LVAISDPVLPIGVTEHQNSAGKPRVPGLDALQPFCDTGLIAAGLELEARRVDSDLCRVKRF
jgi:hypothetical protein